MNADALENKVNKAWKTLIAESPIYLLTSSKKLEKSKNFFILGYYQAIKDSYL